MSRNSVALSTASIAGGIPGLICAAYGFLSLRAVRLAMEQGSAMPPESTSIAIAGSIIGLFFFHVLAVATTMAHQKSVERFRGIRAFMIALGIISAILVVADVSMLQDIGNQSDAGMGSAGEWLILNVSYSIHSAYVISVLALISLTRRAMKEESGGAPVTKNEALFVTLGYVGMYTGLMGLLSLLLAAAVSAPSPQRFARVVPAFASVVLVPYLVALVAWGLERVRERSLWADEKQMSDSHRAAFRAACATLPVMCVLYVLQTRAGMALRLPDVVWLPVLLFLWLSTYSVAVLCRWRRQ